MSSRRRKRHSPEQIVKKLCDVDAMFIKPEICKTIVDFGDDYLPVVKDKQKRLKAAIEGDFMSSLCFLAKLAPPVSVKAIVF